MRSEQTKSSGGSAKHDTKACTGNSSHCNLQGSRKARLFLDALQLLADGFQIKSIIFNAAGKLVDFSYPAQIGIVHRNLQDFGKLWFVLITAA